MKSPLSAFRRGAPARLLAAVACGLIWVSGCGPGRPKTVPVTGTVTLDGQAVEGASVTFAPEAGGRPALGTTDKDGKFTLKTFEERDGALPGKHKVTVIKKETTGFLADKDGLSGGIAPGGIQEKWIVPRKYSDPNSSGLTADVQPGMGPLEFKLTSK